MKKKLLFILATTAILALSGCSSNANRLSADDGEPQEGEEPAEVEVVTVAPTYVRLDSSVYSMGYGQERQLEPSIRPLTAYNAKFNYSSSDETIATVDKNGKLTAASKEGSCIITITSVDDPTVTDSARVYVAKTITSPSKRNLQVAKMYNLQRTNYYNTTTGEYDYPDTVKSSMSYKNYISVDGNVKESFNLFRDFIVSKSNAYFSMATTASYTNTYAPVATHYQNYQYQMLANPGRYDSFIFYTSDSRKNVYYANTGFMADEIDEQGKKLPLMEVVYRLLDSLFSTGREMATDNIERALEVKYLNTTKINGAVSGEGDDILFGTYTVYDDEQFQLATDQESSYGFPAGTTFNIDLSYTFVWERGLCRSYGVNQQFRYTLSGKDYVENYDITYGITKDEEVGLTLPNVKDYNLVTDLYDL